MGIRSGAAPPPATILATTTILADRRSVIIRFESDGGFGYFPGLSQPVRIDTDKLPAGEATELEGLVERSGFFDQAPDVGAPPPGAADYRSYTITVEEGGRTHTITTTDALQDPALRRLIDRLRAHQRDAHAS